jgi:hypothetical protein
LVGWLVGWLVDGWFFSCFSRACDGKKTLIWQGFLVVFLAIPSLVDCANKWERKLWCYTAAKFVLLVLIYCTLAKAKSIGEAPRGRATTRPLGVKQ